MRIILYIITVSCVMFLACGPVQERNSANSSIDSGQWIGILRPQDVTLPFEMEIKLIEEDYRIELINAEERISLDGIKVAGDSIHIPMYIFDATIHARIIDQHHLVGVWIKNYADDYVVPFEARYGEQSRFELSGQSVAADFSGKWEVDFITEDKTRKSIGIFKQQGNRATGTFLNPGGDYRFLEGVVDGNVLKLSCFDGTHAYLFHAKMLEDGSIEGEYWSGKTWHQRWAAKRNEGFELPDPYATTYMKEGFDAFEFTFPNTTGAEVALSDEVYKDKVIVVQLLGSWCPNCMDETRFYADWYRKNKNRGVAFIGLAFERKADFDYASKRIEKMKDKLEVDYEVLIAGTTSDESKAEALPMLNKVSALPTSIILDKKHRVRKIHTGFSGPGTGDYYDRYVAEFNKFMDKLVSE